jgi:hypothetical protein
MIAGFFVLIVMAKYVIFHNMKWSKSGVKTE